MTSPAPPPRFPSPGWAAHVAQLVEAGNDAALVQLATLATHAGTQVQLAALAGLSEEAISRAKGAVHWFSPTSRAWIAAYLLDPATPPPPMPRRPGGRPQGAAGHPQVGLPAELARRFTDAARTRGGLGEALTAALRGYLARHGRRKWLPVPTGAAGPVTVRGRVPKEVLEAFDARVGGSAQRADYMRAAIEAWLDALEVVEKTTRRGSRGKTKRAA